MPFKHDLALQNATPKMKTSLEILDIFERLKFESPLK
jgi:hypothetical protein